MTRLDARRIAAALGGEAHGDQVSAPGPGHSPKDRSLSLKLNGRAPGGFVVYSHSGDDPIVCRDYVRERLGLESFCAGAQRKVQLSVTAAGTGQDEQRRKEFAAKIWRQAVNPVGTIVEKYLRDFRGLALTSDVAGAVVKYHGALRYNDLTVAGLVCLLRNIVTDEPCGIHRTFLNPDGSKIDRRMLGVARGSAIKIDAQNAVADHLIIGEGFETTYAARVAGFGPAWAVGSAGAIAAFPVIGGISELTLLEERDASSRQAIRKCGQRYVAKQRVVNIVTPKIGKDFNDVWLEARNAGC